MKQKNKYKICYINGDSFSAGAGLANEEVFPEHDIFKQRYNVTNVWQSFSDRIPRIHKIIDGCRDYISLMAQEKKKSFAEKIKEKHDLITINSSYGGSSLGEICHSSISDISNLLKQYKPCEIFVTIMLTSSSRMCIPKSTPTGPMKRTYSSILPTFDHLNDPKNVKDFLFLNANDQFLLINGISSICTLIVFLNSLKINYCFLDSSLYSTSLKTAKDIDFNISHFSLPIDAPITSWFSENDNIFLPCGHFSEEVHERIADYIINNFIKTYE
jgi:hypothetical protein